MKVHSCSLSVHSNHSSVLSFRLFLMKYLNFNDFQCKSYWKYCQWCFWTCIANLIFVIPQAITPPLSSRQGFFGHAICKPFFILWSNVHYHSKLFQNLVNNFTPRQQQLYAALKHSSQQQPEWGAVDHRSQRGVGKGVFSAVIALHRWCVIAVETPRAGVSILMDSGSEWAKSGRGSKGKGLGVGRLSLILQGDSDDN